MTVEVDLSELRKVHRKAAARLRRTGEVMHRELVRAAERERRTHSYQNRTHMLENTTTAIKVGDHVAELVMLQEYASYVNNRGFSNIDEVAKAAEGRITVIFEKAGE